MTTTDGTNFDTAAQSYGNNYATNSTIGIPAKKNFEHEVQKYSYMWREGGQFSKETFLK